MDELLKGSVPSKTAVFSLCNSSGESLYSSAAATFLHSMAKSELWQQDGIVHMKNAQVRWYAINVLAQKCGYSNAHKAGTMHIPRSCIKTLAELAPDILEDTSKLTHNDLIKQYTNDFGARSLIARSRKAGSIDVAKSFGIEVSHIKSLYPEMQIIYHLKEAFKGCNMQEQFAVGDFRIDLYFVDQKIAVECDENGHRGRDLGAEIARQQFITKQLDCKWVRFNPDAKDFSIFAVINNIMRLLL
ncbi:TPA: hypothetical protein ACH3X2_000612 [Trebouxia sp. C0005]